MSLHNKLTYSDLLLKVKGKMYVFCNFFVKFSFGGNGSMQPSYKIYI